MWHHFIFFVLTACRLAVGEKVFLVEKQMAETRNSLASCFEIIASPSGSDVARAKSIHEARLKIVAANFGNEKFTKQPIDHMLLFKCLGVLIQSLKGNIEDDAYVILINIQAACPPPDKKVWIKWMEHNKSPDDIKWTWP